MFLKNSYKSFLSGWSKQSRISMSSIRPFVCSSIFFTHPSQHDSPIWPCWHRPGKARNWKLCFIHFFVIIVKGVCNPSTFCECIHYAYFYRFQSTSLTDLFPIYRTSFRHACSTAEDSESPNPAPTQAFVTVSDLIDTPLSISMSNPS